MPLGGLSERGRYTQDSFSQGSIRKFCRHFNLNRTIIPSPPNDGEILFPTVRRGLERDGAVEFEEVVARDFTRTVGD